MTFSLVALWAVAFCGPYQQLNKELGSAKSADQAIHVVMKAHPKDANIQRMAMSATVLKGPAKEAEAAKLRQAVAIAAMAESAPTVSGAQRDAAAIKASILYRDDPAQSSNWFGKEMEALGDMLQRLAEWIGQLFQGRSHSSHSANGGDFSFLGVWITFLIWAVLAALLIGFVAFALRHFRWQVNLKRRSRALLEEDEPERTVDEWLARADLLASEGKYREAVRCLYLACLLKFDEARIARFDRGQTNWEHLARIESSPILPRGLEFRSATQAFDRIWYGMRVNGMQDVEQFRDWYSQISSFTQVKAA